MKLSYSIHMLAALTLLITSGCSQPENQVHPGDTVLTDFTCRLADGGLVETTLAHIAGNETIAKSILFSLRDRYTPLNFQVPDQTTPPLSALPYDPLEMKIGLAIAQQSSNLLFDQPVTLGLESEEVKDFPANERYLQMARKYRLPRTTYLLMAQIKARYGNKLSIAEGTVIDDKQFRSVIRKINGEMVTVYSSALPGATVASVLGPAPVRELDDKHFEVNVAAHEGQLVQRVGGLPGRISSVDDNFYTIDFGQSFAGELLTCEVISRPAPPEQDTKRLPIHLIKDYHQGLAQARRQGKLVLLLLTADDCPTCTKTAEDILHNPSLNALRDRFVLVNIHDKQQAEIAERFGHHGYPLTLIVDGMGKELARLSGEQHIATIAYRLDQVLGKGKKG